MRAMIYDSSRGAHFVAIHEENHADDDRIVRVAQAFSPANYFGRPVSAAVLPIATKIPCNKACGLGGHPGT